MNKHSLEDLNRLYDEANSCDEELFAEMRSNLLLVSGNHYSRKSSASFFAKARNTARLSDSQKLRLTKNHIHKIVKHYENAIMSKAPGVTVSPQNDLEMQDRKAAELNLAVWEDAKRRYNLKDKQREWASNFVEIGEVGCFIYYEPNSGALKGYEPLVDEATGLTILDEQGHPVADEKKPIFEGGFTFKTIFGFNVLREPSAMDMRGSKYHIIREMVDRKVLEQAYGDDPAKKKVLGEGDPDAFVVFDTNKRTYSSSKNQILLRYHFFKPCNLYPEGYFYVSTERGVLEEGPLPFGIYPFVWRGFEEYASNPRAYSIIKVARPYQAEINRASSQQAQHHIQVGDDKIIYQSGTKLAPGALLPGVRGLTYQGAPPQILPGRDGGQFTEYIGGQITEMYSACMLEEINAENESGQLDPYSLLFRSASQAQKFAQYTEKFESFLQEVCFTYLEMAKKYLPDDAVIQAVGKSETINIAEFRQTTPLSYSIKIEPQTDAVDTKLGKQIALNHVLQYVGNQLDPKQIGLVLKEMPFLNNKMLYQRLTLDYDNAESDMLALERGMVPELPNYADNKIYVDLLTHRMKQADFKILPPIVQQNYKRYLKLHEDEIQRKIEAEKAAQSDFIPTGGALITCTMQVPDPSTPSKTRQVRLPYEALMWLIKRLDSQGSGLQQLENMNSQVIAELSSGMQQAQTPSGLPPELAGQPAYGMTPPLQ